MAVLRRVRPGLVAVGVPALMGGLGFKLRDSCSFTPEGRRLLASLGVVDPDPLVVEAERWLLEHEAECEDSPPATAVRDALGIEPWPAEFLEAADRMRATSWKGPLT